MDYQTYSNTAQAVAKYVDEENYESAVRDLESLIHGDISDLDKSYMCYNMAVVCEKMDQFDRALEWYDAAIAFEAPYFRFMAAEYKAAALANKGRPAESIVIYEDLLRQPYLTEADKERVWKNITILRNPRR